MRSAASPENGEGVGLDIWAIGPGTTTAVRVFANGTTLPNPAPCWTAVPPCAFGLLSQHLTGTRGMPILYRTLTGQGLYLCGLPRSDDSKVPGPDELLGFELPALRG